MRQKTIFRTVKQQKFTTVDNEPYLNADISWKAKGLIAYLLTKPDDWETNIEDLKKRSTDGKDSVKSGLKELEQAGYIFRHQEHNADGTFAQCVIEVHEGKVPENYSKKPTNPPQTEKPLAVKPSTDKPQTVNPLQVNTETKLTTDKSKNSIGTRAEIPTHCFEIADSMILFVKTQWNLNKANSRHKWADVIRKMNTIDKVPLDQIQRAITWYAALPEYPQYCPIIQSAVTLREKWVNLINYSKTLANQSTRADSISQQTMSDMQLLMK